MFLNLYNSKYDVNRVIEHAKAGFRNGFNVVLNHCNKVPVFDYGQHHLEIQKYNIKDEQVFDFVNKSKKYGYAVLAGLQHKNTYLVCIDVDIDDVDEFPYQTAVMKAIKTAFSGLSYHVEQTPSNRYHIYLLFYDISKLHMDKKEKRSTIKFPFWKKKKDGDLVDGEIEIFYGNKICAVYDGLMNDKKPFFVENSLTPNNAVDFEEALDDFYEIVKKQYIYYFFANVYHIIYKHRAELNMTGWDIDKNIIAFLFTENTSDYMMKLVFQAVYRDDYDERFTENLIENAKEKAGSDELQTIASVVSTLKQAKETLTTLTDKEKELIDKAYETFLYRYFPDEKVKNDNLKLKNILQEVAKEAVEKAYPNADVFFDLQQEKYLICYKKDHETAHPFVYHETSTFTHLLEQVITDIDFIHHANMRIKNAGISVFEKDNELIKAVKREVLRIVPKIRQSLYIPLQPRVIDINGDLFFNIYMKSKYDDLQRTDELSYEEALEILEKECQTILAFIKNLTTADIKKMRYLTEYMAHKIKYAEKIQTALLLFGPQGSGKSTIAGEILRYGVGDHNYTEIGEFDMNSPFNSWIAGKRLVVFDEVKMDLQKGFTPFSYLKIYITQQRVQVNEKHVKRYPLDSYADFILFSNYEDPVKIEEKDRRFFVIRTGGPLVDVRTGTILSPYLRELSYTNMKDVMKDFIEQRDTFIRTLLRMRTDLNFLRYDLFTPEKFDLMVKTMSQLELFVFMLKDDVVTLLERVDAKYLVKKLENDDDAPTVFYEKVLKAVYELLNGFIETSLLPVLYQYTMNDKQKSDKTVKDTVSSQFEKDRVKVDGDSVRVVIFRAGLDREYIRHVISNVNKMLMNKNYKELADDVIKKLQIEKLNQMTKEMKNDDDDPDDHDPKDGSGGIEATIDDEPENINQVELQDINVDEIIKKATQNADDMVVEAFSTPSSVKQSTKTKMLEPRNSNPEVETVKTEHEAEAVKQESKHDEPQQEPETDTTKPEAETITTNQEPKRKTYRDIAVIVKSASSKKNKKKSKNRKLIQTQTHTDETEQDKITEEVVIDETQLDLTAIEQYELPEIDFKLQENIKKYEDLRVGVFDIEATGLDPEKDRTLAICYKVYQNGQELESKTYLIDEYESERELIKAFLHDVLLSKIDVLAGYNILEFDLEFLAKKINKKKILYIDKEYQRKIANAEKWTDNYIYQPKLFIGERRVYVVDVYALVLKYDFTERILESHNLKYVAEFFGFKADDRVILQHTDIEKAYRDDREAFLNYLTNDVKEAYQIFHLLYPRYYYLRFIMPFELDFEDVYVMSTAKMWEKLLSLQYPKSYYDSLKPDKKLAFQGGYTVVNEGLYTNVYKLDISSMYPHIMLNYKVHPQKDKDAYMLAYLDLFKNKRLEYKKLAKSGDTNADLLQSALKILINSGFGFCGTEGMKFNDYVAAAAITSYGRKILKYMIKFLEDRGAKIVECDTDGIYYVADEGEKIYQELRGELNRIKFDIELEYRDAVMFASDKKNYILYLKDKIVIKGSKWRGRDKSNLRRRWAIQYIKTLATDPVKAKDMGNEMRELIRSGQAWEWLACNVRVSKTDKYLLSAGYREGDRVRHCYVDSKRKTISTTPDGGYDIKYYLIEFEKLLKEIHSVVYADKSKQEH